MKSALKKDINQYVYIEKDHTTNTKWKCVILSAIGVFLFLMPMSYQGKLTLTIGIVTNWLTDIMTPIMPVFVQIVILASALGSLLYLTIKPKFMTKSAYWRDLFDTTPTWYIMRFVASVVIVMYALKIGPEWIIGDKTGGYVITQFLNSFISTIFVGGALMTFLLDFGIMDFFGSLLSKFFKALYKIPGYAAIDCFTSWLGTAVVGVLMTRDRYQKGFYSQREAAIIMTTFSAVAIPFVIVINSTLGLEDYFFEFFYISLLTGFIAAIIMVRIPPLSRKKDIYMVDEPSCHINKPEGMSRLRFAKGMAFDRAAESKFSIKNIFVTGGNLIVIVGITTMPIVLFLGTVCLALQEYTPIFEWLGTPFIPLLELLNVPEAADAAGCMTAGFGDNFIPAIIASATIESDYTKFVIGVLSICQLIYMSEVGALIIGSKVSIGFLDCLVIFVERTVICLIIIIALARLLVF